MTAKQLIDLTVKHTVAELQRAGLIRENRLDSFKKTERILYEYPKFKKIVSEYKIDGLTITPKFVKMIDDALRDIADDPYFQIIELKYFNGWTHEQIAEYFNVQPAAISKQRTKLINRIRAGIFSDDFISELYNDV
jgi:sigma-70, region 4